MPSLKDLRNRITSVKATRKITKAMQMVAAAKLRRAQEVATAARPYADRMDQMMASLGARVTDKGASPLLVGTGSDQVHLLIVMTGERGLAGTAQAGQERLPAWSLRLPRRPEARSSSRFVYAAGRRDPERRVNRGSCAATHRWR